MLHSLKFTHELSFQDIVHHTVVMGDTEVDTEVDIRQAMAVMAEATAEVFR